MHIRLTFDKEMKDTVETILKNETEQFNIKFNKSRTMRLRGWLARRKFGVDMKPEFTYEVHDYAADVNVNTGLDWIADKKRVLKAFKEYEKVSEGKISVEMIKDE